MNKMKRTIINALPKEWNSIVVDGNGATVSPCLRNQLSKIHKNSREKQNDAVALVIAFFFINGSTTMF
jgi:hypothetical protein